MTRLVRGVAVPWILYGTAWKEDRTAALAGQALATGFRGIDTANQRKHYFEAGVGEALAMAAIPRDQLFIQTKFTYQRGQDERLPYDPSASLSKQVAQSHASSLEHLGVDFIDSYVLHGPWDGVGWSAEDREVWAAMELLHAEKKVRLLGLSNATLAQLQACWENASVRPAFVQNRTYARTGWDREIRTFCAAHDIVYQGFSLLTANRRELDLTAVKAIATAHDATVAQVVFAFARAVGILPLTGTSSAEHLAQDLAAANLTLHADELAVIDGIGS